MIPAPSCCVKPASRSWLRDAPLAMLERGCCGTMSRSTTGTKLGNTPLMTTGVIKLIASETQARRVVGEIVGRRDHVETIMTQRRREGNLSL